MNITTGTGSRLTSLLPGMLIVMLAAGCHTPDTPDENGKAVALVTVTHPQRGLMENMEQLPAMSLYLQKNLITTPVAGYVMEAKAKIGDRVQKGQLLYVLETKERHAMGNDSLQLKSYGIVSVTAPEAGIISVMNVQQSGSFVLEGSSLCTIAAAGSLAFQLNIPYELKRFVQAGQSCRIMLPDSTALTATVVAPLTQISPDAQTQPYLARPVHPTFLPENLIATAQIITYRHPDAQLLPRSCILSDELMHHFWVMKLISDSVAVKIPVQPGHKNDSLTEITDPVFAAADRILQEGNYGLSDTAAVKIR